MKIDSLLNTPAESLKGTMGNAPSSLHADISFIKRKLNLKGARGLVDYFIKKNEIKSLREAHSSLKDLSAKAIVSISTDPKTTLASLIIALSLINGIKTGDATEIVFPREMRAAKTADPLKRYRQWIYEQFEELTDNVVFLSPVEWAEDRRYLPPEVTSMPGPFSWDVCPFWVEPMECLSPESPVRFLDIMKGVQTCFTVGILENIIGYSIDHVKNAPMMLLTADAELAKIRMDNYITPMITHSGLTPLIQSNDIDNNRKTGKTKDMLQWQGGGFLIPFGAQNANKLRSVSIQYLLQDEVDSYPINVGRDGKPGKLAEDRTSAYETSRKVLRGSTPLFKTSSVISKEYELGDKRKYMVPCKHCGKKQELIWQKVNENGDKYGVTFKIEDGVLDYDSVRYKCKFCLGEHINDDKTKMCALGTGEWVPTAKPSNPFRRSYHISALYSPPGMQSWETCVTKWLDAWDIEEDRVKDVLLLQQFYNNVLGLPFEERGEQISFSDVVIHRREAYKSTLVPNRLAMEETGGPIQMLTCAADIHKNHIDIQVIGWCAGGQFYSVDYMKIEGEWKEIDEGAWLELVDIIDNREYLDEDGARYPVQVTLIDSQWKTDEVYRFCSQWDSGVYPIQGRTPTTAAKRVSEFGTYATALGTQAHWITVSLYKDRLASALKRDWSGMGHQPPNHPNFPSDYPDKFFKELTRERKREMKNKDGTSIGFVWYRPGNADNHALDITVYNMAAREIVALNICQLELGLEGLDMPAFNMFVEKTDYFRILK